jgi:hypothetical protein
VPRSRPPVRPLLAAHIGTRPLVARRDGTRRTE